MGQATLQGVNNAPQTNGAGVTETKVGDKVGLDVNLIGGGGSGGTSSDFGAAFPATGTAAGFEDPSGNMAAGNLDADGNLKVAGTLSVTEKTILSATGAVSANTSIVGAVTGKRIKVVAVKLETAYSAGTITPIFTDGNGGTTLCSSLLQAISGTISGDAQAVAPPGWLFGTAAGNALYFNPNGQTVNYFISYFTDDAS